jgi:hypothetical protein
MSVFDDLGHTFKAAGKLVWDTVKRGAKVVWDALVTHIACAAGIAGYGIAVTRMQFSEGSPARRLKEREIAVCDPILALGGHGGVNLHDVSLITGASLGWLPGSKAGLTLGNTVYLKNPEVDACNWKHMKLLIHELVHVHQYQTLGRLGFSCLYGALIAQDFDTNNALERDAERVEDGFLTQLDSEISKACPGAVTTSRSASPRNQSDWFWVVWS